MIQIAGDESSFDWLGTFGLILLPGAVLGALLGWAADLQLNGNLSSERQRWLMASPLVLAAALFDPRIFQLLITNGQGGGALGVVVIGVTGAYALSGRGSRPRATISGLVALLLIVACGSVAADSTPLTTPHGAWIATQAVSLLAVLCVACSIPYRTTGVPDRQLLPGRGPHQVADQHFRRLPESRIQRADYVDPKGDRTTLPNREKRWTR